MHIVNRKDVKAFKEIFPNTDTNLFRRYDNIKHSMILSAIEIYDFFENGNLPPLNKFAWLNPDLFPNIVLLLFAMNDKFGVIAINCNHRNSVEIISHKLENMNNFAPEYIRILNIIYE